MSGDLRVGLIGCGRAAERYYLPVLARRSLSARLVAVADPLPERTLLATSFVPDCKTFDCVETLLQESSLDAIVVASSPETHAQITMRALQAGLAVLVEKPVATSTEQARALEEQLAHASGSVMVGFNQRHWEPVERLESVLRRKDRTGEVSADLRMTVNIAGWSPVAGVVNPLEDLGPHLLDLLRFLLRREILALAASQSTDGAVDLRVRLSGGTTARCRVAHGGLTEESIDLQWERECYLVRMGSDRIEPPAGFTRSLLDFSEAGYRRLRGRRASLHYSHERQLLRFLAHVRGGERPTPAIEDGLAVARAVEAAKRSLIRGSQEVLVQK